MFAGDEADSWDDAGPCPACGQSDCWLGCPDAEIDADVQIWAVWNPYKDSAESVEEKIEAGAEVIVSQPPILSLRFMESFREVQARGLCAPSERSCRLPAVLHSPQPVGASRLALVPLNADAGGRARPRGPAPR